MHENICMHDVGADDSILTAQKIDILAAKLGSCWKRFARKTEMISEGDIYEIEYSSHSIYERCYQMIILWQRKSREVINVTMVIDILMVIQRNDLVRDLNGEGMRCCYGIEYFEDIFYLGIPQAWYSKHWNSC